MARPFQRRTDAPTFEITQAPQGGAVVSRPVSTAVMPGPTNDMLQLAESLQGLNPALKQYANRRRKEEEESLTELAKTNAMMTGYQPFKEAQEAASTETSPVYRRSYLTAQGFQAGLKAEGEVRDFVEKAAHGEEMGPEEMRSGVRDILRKYVEGVTDTTWMQGYNAYVGQVTQWADHQIGEAQRKLVRRNSENGLRDGVMAMYDKYKTLPDGGLDALKAWGADQGLTNTEVENLAFDNLSEQVLNTLDMSIVREFEASPAPGVASFAEREPTKYYALQRAVQAALKRDAKTTDKRAEAQYLAAIDADIERVTASGEMLTNEQMGNFHKMYLDGMEQGFGTVDGFRSINKQLMEHNRKALVVRGHAEGATKGVLRSMGLSPSEADAALIRATKDTTEGIRTGPGDDKVKSSSVAKVEASTALLNGMVYPTHRGVMTNEVLKLPAMVDGKETMPESFKDAAQLASMYRQGLQSDAAFVSAFPDQTGRDAAAFFLRYQEKLEQDPKRNIENAYLATVREFRGRAAPGGSSNTAPGASRFSKEQSEKFAKDIYGKLNDGRTWSDKLPFIGRDGLIGAQNDRIFQAFIRAELDKTDPLMKDEAIVATLAARFQAKYVPIGGRWIQKPSESMAFTPDRLANLEKAMEAYKPVVLLGPGAADLMATTGPNWKDADLYLSSEPVEGGVDPKHEVLVNGMPTGLRISLTTLEKQYNAKTGKYNGDTEAFKKALEAHRVYAAEMAKVVDPTPEQLTKYRQHFELAFGVGLVTKNGYEEGMRLIGNYETRLAEKQAEELADAQNAAQRNDKATIGLRAPLEDAELVALRNVPKASPDVREATRLMKYFGTQGDDTQLGAAMSAAVLGYHPSRYQNAAGTFVGFGFSLDRDDKAIIADLKQAKVTVTETQTRFNNAAKDSSSKAVLAGLRDGSFRLTEVQALRLAEVEWKRAGKQAADSFTAHRMGELIDSGALGETAKKDRNFLVGRAVQQGDPNSMTWKKLTPTTQYALTALRRFSKTDADFVEAVKALDRNDFATLQKHLITTDPRSAGFAPALIRLLGQGKDKLRAHLQILP